jgi:hypothetical protein
VRKIGQVWRNTANNPDTSQAAKFLTLPHHKPRNFLPCRITGRETFLCQITSRPFLLACRHARMRYVPVAKSTPPPQTAADSATTSSPSPSASQATASAALPGTLPRLSSHTFSSPNSTTWTLNPPCPCITVTSMQWLLPQHRMRTAGRRARVPWLALHPRPSTLSTSDLLLVILHYSDQQGVIVSEANRRSGRVKYQVCSPT